MAKRRGQVPQPAEKRPEYFSAGRYSTIDETGKVQHNEQQLSRISAARKANAKSKTAGIFNDGELGPANIADSNNIGYYSYQFPVDALEMPASRAEELNFYRLAYTRDPIVARAIDLHTELPLSKMKLEKPKCSVEAFSDYVFDFYQRLMTDTRMFNEILQATREYHTIGEAFLFIEQPEGFGELNLSKAAAEALKKGRGYQAGVSPLTEAQNGGQVGQEREILPDFINSRHKQSSKQMKKVAQALQSEFADAGLSFRANDEPDEIHRQIIQRKAKLAKLIKTAEPGDAAPAAGAPANGAPPEATPAGAPADPGADPTMDGAGADLMGDGADVGGGTDFGGGSFGGGGGGSFGGGGSIPGDMAQDAQNAVTTVRDAKRQREISDLKRYIHLLERKKQLLEELEELADERRLEKEIFGHITNEDYEGFEKIQILQPERIEIKNDSGSPQILYKPSEEEKNSYMEDGEVPEKIKEALAESGTIPLNQSPYVGSYVIHFARKKSGYELHGRSALQSCMRSIIYREKLRQVQTTLASRNMTPKTLIVAPGVSEIQVAQLRAHADEAKSDPDYTIVTNYECTWQEIDSQGRLLSLGDEWQHTNANLAIGLGFSPEILIGEGMYGNNRVQVQLMENTYVQFREELSDVIENLIFKPIAIIKSYYEKDNYGRPRWIYPKVTFGQLALRDSGDMYEMLFNLYSKGSLPVSTIYEMLGLDSETIKRELEDDLFTVNDSKFSELLGSLYGALGGEMVGRTDILKRIAQNTHLLEEVPDQDGMEGSGEGM